MNAIRISITANEGQQEELIALLSDLPVNGFEETPDSLIAWFPAADFEKDAVDEILQGYQYVEEEVEEKNWNEEWERNFKPVVVGNFCSVRASFHPPVASTEHEIVITPKMSFGTGHHATTWMMIDQMKAIDFTNKRVFDFGTGTGILAILAEKLGAAEVVAIDVDEWSVSNAEENVRENACKKIKIIHSTGIPSGPFDVILANINRNVILQYMNELKDVVGSGGTLLVSGLLRTDEDQVRDSAAKNGFKLSNRLEKDNWICLVFSN
jgi:ribosomal protein L11 methyltransferase